MLISPCCARIASPRKRKKRRRREDIIIMSPKKRFLHRELQGARDGKGRNNFSRTSRAVIHAPAQKQRNKKKAGKYRNLISFSRDGSSIELMNED